jgi:hypothetical protein
VTAGTERQPVQVYRRDRHVRATCRRRRGSRLNPRVAGAAPGRARRRCRRHGPRTSPTWVRGGTAPSWRR